MVEGKSTLEDIFEMSVLKLAEIAASLANKKGDDDTFILALRAIAQM